MQNNDALTTHKNNQEEKPDDILQLFQLAL